MIVKKIKMVQFFIKLLHGFLFLCIMKKKSKNGDWVIGMSEKKHLLRMSESTGIRLLHNAEGFEHIHSRAEFAVVLDGRIWVKREEREYLLSCGEAVLLMPYEMHAYRPDGESDVIIAEFDPTYSEELSGVAGCIGGLFHVSESTRAYLMSIYPQREDSSIYLKSFIYPVLREFFLENKSWSKMRSHSQLLQDVFRYIEEHFPEEITLKSAAAAIGCSYVYLSRAFSGAVGLPFTTYVNRFRIIQSLRVLKGSDVTVTEAAYECGFGSVRSYNRSFQKYLGMTPREYRQYGYCYFIKG